ncbi:TIM barrel protein [Streptosporangium nondiastaticum]|nr:TIM barrel protein [Streptosporangium nondiastaticum]
MPHPMPHGTPHGTPFPRHRFAVNLSMLFTGLPLLERPAAAAAAGFDAVEMWWPWPATPTPPDRELDALRRALDDAGTRLVGLNFYAGQLPGPDRGALSVPGAESARFRANLDVATGFAASLGCTALNALYGNRIAGADPRAQDALALENLVRAAEAADRVGAQVLIEALNPVESPAYPLTGSAAAVALAERVNEATGLGNARFLMDLYHLAVAGEDVAAAITAYGKTCGHVQLADAPGRGAPGSGVLDVPDLLERLERAGYGGWVGLEYRAASGAGAFDWLDQPRRPAHDDPSTT